MAGDACVLRFGSVVVTGVGCVEVGGWIEWMENRFIYMRGTSVCDVVEWLSLVRQTYLESKKLFCCGTSLRLEFVVDETRIDEGF